MLSSPSWPSIHFCRFVYHVYAALKKMYLAPNRRCHCFAPSPRCSPLCWVVGRLDGCSPVAKSERVTADGGRRGHVQESPSRWRSRLTGVGGGEGQRFEILAGRPAAQSVCRSLSEGFPPTARLCPTAAAAGLSLPRSHRSILYSPPNARGPPPVHLVSELGWQRSGRGAEERALRTRTARSF